MNDQLFSAKKQPETKMPSQTRQREEIIFLAKPIVYPGDIASFRGKNIISFQKQLHHAASASEQTNTPDTE